nr:peptidylprolyl isomerase [Bacteroidales bacterium]
GVLVMSAIGLAMLGFILGDFNVGSGSSKIAEINGETYGIEDYQNEQQTLLNFYKMNYGENLDPAIEQQIEDETWKRMVRTSVMGKSYSSLGLEVSTDELKAMVAGDQASGIGGTTTAAFSEPHPIVRQMFSNPETGEFNRYIMTNYFNSLDREEYAQERTRWKFIENEIVDERLNQKYLTLISKALRPSTLDVKDNFRENGKKVDFSYVSKNFSAISDEDITVSEADLKAYYKKNIEKYKSSESRSIEYVVFNVVASEDDDANSKLWSVQTKNEFSRIKGTDVASYVNGVSDQPLDVKYHNPSELSEILRDSLLGAPKDYIFGPYYEDNAYKLSRINHTALRPDSVRARHILIGYNIVADANRAEEIADSLKTVIEAGGDFNAIARDYSADESNRSIGGDLGWFAEGQMETPFNNACFQNKTGDIVITTTRYGVHIVKIEAQSKAVDKVQIATIVHSVYPSNETDQDFYNRAVKFRGKATTLAKFDEQAKEYGLDPRIVPAITKDQRTIPGLSTSVQIIGWAFTSDDGDVSSIFEVDDQYIVAAITEVKEDGHSDFESVRNEVELAVTKQKKAEVIIAAMKSDLAGASDLASFASAQGLQVNEAAQVQFANTYVSGIGLEPFIVGTTMNLPLDKIAGPYIGENSVFVLNVNNREEADLASNMDETKTRLNFSLQSRSSYEAYNAMLDKAKIEDNRLKIFYGR